jgi:hypothetical protein
MQNDLMVDIEEEIIEVNSKTGEITNVVLILE